jgi:isochorismate synthase
MISFLDKTKKHFDEKLPFVVYRKPNDDKIFGVYQSNDNLHEIIDFFEKGIAFCSFDGNHNYIIPIDISETFVFKNEFKDIISDPTSEVLENFNDKKTFENKVIHAIEVINNGDFKKLVLSRKELVAIHVLDLQGIISKLFSQYQSAFRYCFFHPKIGLWFGATPEQFLQVNNENFKTVALAGTQKFNGSIEVVWQNKELEEQKFVSDFISENLKKYIQNIEISTPFSVRAANLVHLKSEVSGTFKNNVHLKEVISILHPTPAVCGLPKAASMQYIKQHENYDREFYSGFIGELNVENKSDLFVNLRCMKIENQFAHIFIGCGITKDSVPESEFQETVNKSMTMKNVLKNLNIKF